VNVFNKEKEKIEIKTKKKKNTHSYKQKLHFTTYVRSYSTVVLWHAIFTFIHSGFIISCLIYVHKYAEIQNFLSPCCTLNALPCQFRFVYGIVMFLLYDFKFKTIHLYSYLLVVIFFIRLFLECTFWPVSMCMNSSLTFDYISYRYHVEWCLHMYH
jgi:hypothetical protein